MNSASFGFVVQIRDPNGSCHEIMVSHGPVEMGRQSQQEEHLPLYRLHRASSPPGPDRDRILIAKLQEVNISRAHVVIETCSGNKAFVSNVGKAPVVIKGEKALQKNERFWFDLPIELNVSDREVIVRMSGRTENDVVSVSSISLLASQNPDAARQLASAALKSATAGTLGQEAVISWIQAMLGVLQGAAGTLEFLPRAARTLVELIGLDLGRVLLRAGDAWVERSVEKAQHLDAGEIWPVSDSIIGRVVKERATCIQYPALGATTPQEESLADVVAVVAAPIHDHTGEVRGILYGERRTWPLARGRLGRLEASMVEVLAGAVAVGLARVEQEELALRAQGQMEQFFTRELARHLAEHPEELRGRDCEVTLLSCDVRGFSRICERLSQHSAQALEWLQSVLSALSDSVLAENGVLVDYVGDELMNMWGAPAEQPDHARRACRAALAMLQQVPVLNRLWQETVGEPMGVRIGVSSGRARVGNVGSARKFKYGALGSTTNLASRVQGAAKFFGVEAVITEATQRQLGPEFATRRLATVRVVNIAEPITLYELTCGDHPRYADLRAGYERALSYFDAGDFRAAAGATGELLTQPEFRDDGPSLVLLQRAVAALIEKPKEFSPVWTLASK